MQVTILGEENDTTIVFLPGLGGVYSLLGANEYPDEVKGFIEIDRIKSIISGDRDEVRYPYTQEEMELYDYLYLNRFMNSNILSETFLIDRSFEIISGMSFPDSVPVLNLVSSQDGEQMPGWIELHEAVQGNNPNTTMVITEGSHDLTSDNHEALLEEIHNWIK